MGFLLLFHDEGREWITVLPIYLYTVLSERIATQGRSLPLKGIPGKMLISLWITAMYARKEEPCKVPL